MTNCLTAKNAENAKKEKKFPVVGFFAISAVNSHL